MRPRSYAVAPGDRIKDAWSLADFPAGAYHVCVHGPNGFFREFRGTADDPTVGISLLPERPNGTVTGDAVLTLANREATRTFTVHIEDMAYGTERRTVLLGPGKSKTARVEIAIELRGSHAFVVFAIRQTDFPIFARDLAIESDEHGDVEQLMPVAFDKAGDDVESMADGDRGALAKLYDRHGPVHKHALERVQHAR